MPNKQLNNAGKRWTPDQIVQLHRLAMENTPTRVAALKLERSPKTVYGKASDLGLSLKPTNQSPYNRKRN